MTRLFALAGLTGLLLGLSGVRVAPAAEPKATGTVDIFSSVADPDLEKFLPGIGVIYGQKEWERIAAAWGIKPVPKVDFSKEILLVGTWRGPSFKFLSEIKNGDLQVEVVGDRKNDQPGFRYRVVSLNRAGITKFNGAPLPKPDTDTVVDPSPRAELKAEKPTVSLSGDIRDERLLQEVPANGVIVSPKRWEALAKAWSIKDPPSVDFTKNVLVVGTWRGTTFDITPVVTNGDLTIAAKGTKDLAPGFRWRIVSVKREGIKTAQGKELPRE
jgi:hypothetical protein